jgi:hypothetical protein
MAPHPGTAKFQPLVGTNLDGFKNGAFFDDAGNSLPVVKASVQLAHTPEKR